MSMKAVPEENTLNTTLAVQVLVRPVGSVEWQEFDRGPGYIRIPSDQEVSVRARNISDQDLLELRLVAPNVETLDTIKQAMSRDGATVELHPGGEQREVAAGAAVRTVALFRVVCDASMRN